MIVDFSSGCNTCKTFFSGVISKTLVQNVLHTLQLDFQMKGALYRPETSSAIT